MNRMVGAFVLATLIISPLVTPLASDAAEVGSATVALSVFDARTPPVQSRCITTSGTYPQVGGAGLDLTKVNGSLRRAVLRSERGFGHCPPDHSPNGIYQTSPDPQWISASSVVVSALVPVLALNPGGNDGETWFSVTTRVPSGRVVTFRDLVGSGRARLAAVARQIRREAVRENICVRNALKDPLLGPTFAKALNPSYSEDFALTTRGLEIGFANGSVTGPACRRVAVKVPYSIVRMYLSTLGKQLVAGVRRPR